MTFLGASDRGLGRSVLVPGVVPAAEIIFADDGVIVGVYGFDEVDLRIVSALAEGGSLGERKGHLDGGRCRGRSTDPRGEVVPLRVQDLLLPRPGHLLVAVAAIDLIGWAAGERGTAASEGAV